VSGNRNFMMGNPVVTSQYPNATKPVLATDAVLKATYLGDLNFDGRANGTDLTLLLNTISAQNLGTVVPISWKTGDINYSGAVNGTDLTLLLNAITAQNIGGTYPILGDSAGGAITPVPEPSTIALLLFAFASLFTFKRIWK
jgi:hypothetical protein